MAKQKEEPKRLTPLERGKQYLGQNPNLKFDSVLVTSDSQVFFPDLQGENAASNHSKRLKDRRIIEVKRKESAPESEK